MYDQVNCLKRHKCPSFEKNWNACVFFSPANTPAPCGTNRAEACAYFVEGRFADWVQSCEAYYTCNQGLYFGHNPCLGGMYMYFLKIEVQKSDKDDLCGLSSTLKWQVKRMITK